MLQIFRRASQFIVGQRLAFGALHGHMPRHRFADGAALLHELIRTVMAVEVLPAAKVFAAAGVAPSLIPASINIPRGTGWITLIVWVLGIGDRVPNKAIPEIVQLYGAFSVGTLGASEQHDRCTGG